MWLPCPQPSFWLGIHNTFGQTTVYILVRFQYHVLGCGYERIIRLLEAVTDVMTHRGRPAPECRSLAASWPGWADTCDDLGRQVGHFNLVKTLVSCSDGRTVYGLPDDGRVPHHRTVGRCVGQPTVRQLGRRMLVVKLFDDILLFLVQLYSFCYAGACLSYQTRISPSRYYRNIN